MRPDAIVDYTMDQVGCNIETGPKFVVRGAPLWRPTVVSKNRLCYTGPIVERAIAIHLLYDRTELKLSYPPNIHCPADV
jgi:hypothetical protein